MMVPSCIKKDGSMVLWGLSRVKTRVEAWSDVARNAMRGQGTRVELWTGGGMTTNEVGAE